jgi:hypothetical protein
MKFSLPFQQQRQQRQQFDWSINVGKKRATLVSAEIKMNK